MVSQPRIAVPDRLFFEGGRGTAFSSETQGFQGSVPLSRLLGHGTWDSDQRGCVEGEQ
jgi:hypothetical protein